jgi:hypothetical protein
MNGIVESVKDMTDEEINGLSSSYSNVVSVEGLQVAPSAGWSFDGANFHPPVGASSVASWKITKLSFISRFTDAELIGIEAFTSASNNYAYAVRAALRKQMLATYIDLSLPETINGTQSLVALGLLTSQRCNEILTTPPSSKELYRG